jgi:hypothetical protein
MNIEKFKLVDNGFGGIQCEGTDVKMKDGIQVLLDFSIKYRVPLPVDLITMVQGLKYYFLFLTDLLPEDSRKHFDFELGIPRLINMDLVKEKKSYAYVARLMDKLTITGMRFTDDDLIITGKMVGYDEAVFAINTPLLRWSLVTMGIEEDMKDLCQKIKKSITQFIEEVKLRKMEPRQYLLNLFEKNADELARVKALSDEDAEKEQIENLEKKGFIVVKKEDVIEEILEIHQENGGNESETVVPEPVEY